jgi:hypothetical protein
MQPSKKIAALAALVVVFAVATVLITPDASDDIHGIRRPHEGIKIYPSMSPLVIPLIFLFLDSLHIDSSWNATSHDLFRLICTYRC